MLRILALIALGLVLATPAQAQYRSDLDYYFDRSDRALREQLANIDLHLEQCEAGPKTTRYREALADCAFMLRYFPNHPRALLAVGEICKAWNNPRCEADSYFEHGIAVNPKIPGTYVTYGIYLLRVQRTNDAIVALKKAGELAPNSINAHYNLGLAYIDSKQYDLANDEAQKAYALGAPVPGLKQKLVRLGQWRPAAAVAQPPAATAAEGGQAQAPAASPPK